MSHIELFGKWTLISTEGFGCQPPCRGEGLVVDVGPEVSRCLNGSTVFFLDIECGVLELKPGYVLVHEDYVVASYKCDASPKHHEYPGKTHPVGCSR